MSSTFFGFFDKVFIALLGKVYIVVLCKCATKCRGKGLFRKFSPPPASREPPSQRGPLGGYAGNSVAKVATPTVRCADSSPLGAPRDAGDAGDAAPFIP